MHPQGVVLNLFGSVCPECRGEERSKGKGRFVALRLSLRLASPRFASLRLASPRFASRLASLRIVSPRFASRFASRLSPRFASRFVSLRFRFCFVSLRFVCAWCMVHGVCVCAVFASPRFVFAFVSSEGGRGRKEGWHSGQTEPKRFKTTP